MIFSFNLLNPIKMKRVLFFALLLGFATLQAQNSDEDKRTISKGTWNLGIEANLSTYNAESQNDGSSLDADRFSVGFFPRMGYAFSENWMVGLRTGYNRTKVENDLAQQPNFNQSESKTEVFTFAPYVRKYYGLGKNLLFYAQGEAGYVGSWSENITNQTNRSTTESDQFYVAFRPGITFFVSQKLALESSFGILQYSSNKIESNGAETTSNGFDLGLDSSNILFGLSYYF